MTQRPDETKIEAALKRAADKAMHGSREQRAGRFLVKSERHPPVNDRRSTGKRAAKGGG